MYKFKMQKKMYNLATILEILIGSLVTVAIIISSAGILFKLPIDELFQKGEMMLFLNTTIEIIIGIEFIKLIFSHTLNSAIDVIIVTIVRQIIVEHSTPVDNLISVLSIAILFVIRKYLFVKQLDEHK